MQDDDAVGTIEDAVHLVWRRAAFLCVLAVLLPGVMCLVFFLHWIVPSGAPDPAAERTFLVAFVLFVGAVALGSALHERWRWAQVSGWLRAGRPSHHRGRQVILREPWRQAASTFGVWAGGSLLFAGLDLASVGRPLRSVLLLGGAAFSGLYVAAWVYLLDEQFLKPILRLALSEDDVASNRLTIRARMRLAWLAASGMPLLGIGLALTWRALEPDGTDMTGPLWALVSTGLVAGWLVIGAIGRSVADPIDEVRAGMARVEAGDLDVELAVDDTTEVGRLQDSFNHMAEGLRIAARTRDLFGRQVGDPVARHALDRGIDFDGEQVEASMLFVDLIGSTTLIQTRAAPDMVRLLNVVFTAAVEATEAEGGWVNKFQGDAALCVFGPPDGRPDHAARALRAAVRLRARLRDLSADHPDLDAGIGVASGTVIAGHLGTPTRFEYGVVGDPANEAARLSDAAKTHPARLLAASQTVLAAGVDGEGWSVVDRLQLRGRTVASVVCAPVADPLDGRAAASHPSEGPAPVASTFTPHGPHPRPAPPRPVGLEPREPVDGLVRLRPHGPG